MTAVSAAYTATDENDVTHARTAIITAAAIVEFVFRVALDTLEII
jgi:hypothetical protein